VVLISLKKFIALDGGHYDTLDAAKEVGTAVITYGNLLQAINFVIIALFVFVILRAAEK
jgi:large conductance mechanosensitive channel